MAVHLQLESLYTNPELGLESSVHSTGNRYVVSLRDTDADEEVLSRTTFHTLEGARAYAQTIVGG